MVGVGYPSRFEMIRVNASFHDASTRLHGDFVLRDPASRLETRRFCSMNQPQNDFCCQYVVTLASRVLLNAPRNLALHTGKLDDSPPYIQGFTRVRYAPATRKWLRFFVMWLIMVPCSQANTCPHIRYMQGEAGGPFFKDRAKFELTQISRPICPQWGAP